MGEDGDGQAVALSSVISGHSKEQLTDFQFTQHYGAEEDGGAGVGVFGQSADTNFLSPFEATRQAPAQIHELNQGSTGGPGLQGLLVQLYEKIMADEIAQSLRPNQYTPDHDVEQMRKFYLERVAEIMKDSVGKVNEEIELRHSSEQIRHRDGMIEDLRKTLSSEIAMREELEQEYKMEL